MKKLTKSQILGGRKIIAQDNWFDVQAEGIKLLCAVRQNPKLDFSRQLTQKSAGQIQHFICNLRDSAKVLLDDKIDYNYLQTGQRPNQIGYSTNVGITRAQIFGRWYEKAQTKQNLELLHQDLESIGVNDLLNTCNQLLKDNYQTTNNQFGYLLNKENFMLSLLAIQLNKPGKNVNVNHLSQKVIAVYTNNSFGDYGYKENMFYTVKDKLNKLANYYPKMFNGLPDAFMDTYHYKNHTLDTCFQRIQNDANNVLTEVNAIRFHEYRNDAIAKLKALNLYLTQNIKQLQEAQSANC